MRHGTSKSAITELSWLQETVHLISKNDPNLLTIDGSSQELCDEQIEILLKKLQKTKSPIKTVQLMSNRVERRGAKAIARLIRHNKESVEEVDLGVNDIGDVGARLIGLALPFNNNLQRLCLAGNSVSDGGIKALVEGLSENSSLTHLDLSNNSIGNAGAKAIGKLLVSNRTLKTVNIEWNHCGDTGAKFLSEALKKNTVLQELNLNYNQIGDTGATSFGEGLKINSSLQRLFLWKNSFGTRGEQALLYGLEKNFYLKELWTNSTSCCDCLKDITFYLALNKYGYRQLLKKDEDHVPRSLWPHILSKVGHAPRFNFMGDMGTRNLDLIFYLLQAKVDLFEKKYLLLLPSPSTSQRKRCRSTIKECDQSAISRRALKKLLLSVSSSRE